MNKKITTNKNNYKFYLSFWDSYKLLKTKDEKIEYIELINKIHFFEEHIDHVSIKNANVRLLFSSIKHSLRASIQGYCDKKKIDYDTLFNYPTEGGIEGAYQPPCQEITIGNKQYIIDKEKIELSFNKFWDTYKPINTGKGSKKASLDKYTKLTKNGINHNDLLTGLNNYMKACHDKGTYTKSVLVWLNQECWLDEYETSGSNVIKSGFIEEERRKEREENKKRGIKNV